MALGIAYYIVKGVMIFRGMNLSYNFNGVCMFSPIFIMKMIEGIAP